MNDVLVIGGGAAGLSGALTLARARRSVLVIDSGSPRNAPAGGVHNYLGRENTPPADLLRIGREEVRSYGGRFLDGTAVRAARTGGAFTVTLADGSAVRGRRLLVATGVTDELPDLPGLAGRWGRDVLHCPYCHGTEVADRPVGVLSTGPLAEHMALQWRQWTSLLVLLTHTGLAPKDPGLLAERGIGVVDEEVTGLDVADDRLTGVTLAGGGKVPLEALVVASRPVVRGGVRGVLGDLGLEPVPLEISGQVIGERVAADPAGATRVPGVWVAGNVSDPMAQVIVSAAAGMRAGAAINADLIAEGP
jgi:thioredoxin reductase